MCVLPINDLCVVMIFFSPWHRFVVLYSSSFVVLCNAEIVRFHIEFIKKLACNGHTPRYVLKQLTVADACGVCCGGGGGGRAGGGVPQYLGKQ